VALRSSPNYATNGNGEISSLTGNELIAPEWTEYRSKQQNRHLWRCWKCDYCFETIVMARLL
jgi:hypothetical protein